MKTLSQILIDINSVLDLTAELPTGDDLDSRINLAQQAVSEWASAYRWRQLNKTVTAFVTTATISLATDFREMVYPPHTSASVEYPEVMQQEALSYTSEKYCYVAGNDMSGKNLILNGFPTEGATLSYVYQRYPSNMATLTDICEVPDAEFVKLKTIALVLQSRLDERFPIIDAEAKRILNNMIGREMVQTPGGSLSARRAGSGSWRIGTRFGR